MKEHTEPTPKPSSEPVAIEVSEEIEQELKKGRGNFSWAGILTIGTLGAIGAAGLLMPNMARAKGATVSAQLNWADRTAEIQAAIQAVDNNPEPGEAP
jgi:hypothetical protein